MSFLGAGLSLLGGILGRNSERKAIREQNAYNDPAAIRARYEAAGFNPLLGIAPGVDLQTTAGGGNFLGSALADAGLQIGDALQRRAPQIQRMNAVASENDRLRAENSSLRLAPPVAGVYARGGPSVRSGAIPGGANAASSLGSRGPAGLPALDGPAGRPGGVGVSPPVQVAALPAVGPAGSDKGTGSPRLPISVGHIQIFPSGGNSDADVGETRYGDFMGGIIGAGQAIYDTAWNVGRIVKNGSFDPKYRTLSLGGIDLGGPEARRSRADAKIDRDIAWMLGNRKFDTWGAGARRQEY